MITTEPGPRPPSSESSSETHCDMQISNSPDAVPVRGDSDDASVVAVPILSEFGSVVVQVQVLAMPVARRFGGRWHGEGDCVLSDPFAASRKEFVVEVEAINAIVNHHR